MSEDQSPPRPPTSSSDIASIITAMLKDEDEDSSLLLIRYLAEEPPSSVETPSTPLPASTPTEPRAMTIAKARHRSPQKGAHKDSCLTKSQSPSPVVQKPNRKSPDHALSPAKPARHDSSTLSSPNSIVLPSRSAKRARDHISSSPAAKRIRRAEHTPSPRARNDHWSPPSSRASSPVRSAVLLPATKLQNHQRTNRSTASPEVPRQRATKSCPHTPKLEAKKYPNSTSVMIGSLDNEEGKKKICYNCGKKGHWFMDCKVGCGKYEGDGHRTIDCVVVRSHMALGK